MLLKDKFFRYGLGILLVLVIIYFYGQVEFFLEPFRKFVAILFSPLLTACIFYYILRPCVNFFRKLRLPSILAILIVFILGITIMVVVITYMGSIIVGQLNQLVGDIPGMLDTARRKMTEIINNSSLGQYYTGNIEKQLTTFLGDVITIFSKSILNIIAAIANVTTILFTVPFILFYILKDDRKFITYVLSLIPERYRANIIDVLKDVDKTLSAYITGKSILALAIGIMMYIGYIILDIEFALVLALFAMLTSFIPLFGTFIGVLPAVLVSLADNPFTAVKIMILTTIVQQLEGNVISPLLVGKQLKIHPLTLILLFLVSGSLFGFIGLLISVPAYAVLKVLVNGAFRIYHLVKRNSFRESI